MSERPRSVLDRGGAAAFDAAAINLMTDIRLIIAQ
jgi:hypothetical protein